MRIIVSILVPLAIVVGGVAIGYEIVLRPEPVHQPIAFNHSVHIHDAGAECLQCHTDAQTSVYAGLPGKDICLDCHDVDEEGDDGNPEKAKLFAFDESGEEIPWQRVALTKPDVFFSHRRHVTSGEIDCLRCHRGQPDLTAPPPHAELVMRMTACLACHEENAASTDCIVCHR